MTVLKIILGLLKFALFAVLAVLAAVTVLLCLPVTVHIIFESVCDRFELEIVYLFIPLRILPKDERSVLTKLEKLSGNIKELKEKIFIKFRNRMLMYRPTRYIYRRAENAVRQYKARQLEKKLEKLRKKKKQQTQQKPKEQEKSAFGKLLEERGVGGMISWILELAKIAGGMLRRIFRGIIIKQLDLYMAVGDDDAAQTAINYGRMCAVVLPAISIILSGVRRYRRRIDIRPDFESGNIRAFLETRFMIIPIAVIGHALMALLRMILGEVKRQISERMKEAKAA